jgi:hypothetical protein
MPAEISATAAVLDVYLMLGGMMTCAAATAGAGDETGHATGHSLDTIVVTAKRLDAELRQQVETALHADSYFNDEHITVTIKDGVVTLSGLVFDEWDVRSAKRIAKKIPGVKRVVDDLEITLGGE